MKRRQTLILLASVLPSGIWAQAPRPTRLVVGFAAGGTADLLARMVATGMSERLGQPFIVENRPGANAALAIQAVTSSPPDGSTLLVAAAGPIAVAPSVSGRKGDRFDPMAVLVPVGMIARFPLILVAGQSQPFGTGPELIATAKAQPGKLSYASNGTGSLNHLSGEYLKMRAGLDIVHIPYKGDAASIADLLSGAVSFSMMPAPVAIPLVQAGRLKAIATMDRERSPSLPQVPTLLEQGLSGYEIGSWNGVFAPAGTPPAVIEKLNRTLIEVCSTVDAKARLHAGSMTSSPMSPGEFTQFVKSEISRWQEVATQGKITLEE